MNELPDTFERLVLSLESSERQELLRQLAEMTELQVEEVRALRAGTGPIVEEERAAGPEKKLMEEPFIVRLWFTICAFFTSSSPTRLYSAYLVANLGKELARAYGRYFSLHQRSYTDAMYQEFVKIRRAQVFFASLLESYEFEKGDFFVILGSLLMKNTCAALATASNPFSVPYDETPNRDVRAALLREMDAAFLAVPEDERSKMYQAALTIEWLRSFCAIPVERILQRFGTIENAGETCLIDSIKDEMEILVGVFSSARKVPVLLLEALFIFTKQDAMNEGKFDLEAECKKFVGDAADNLGLIRGVKSCVPLADFVRYTLNDVSWQPVNQEKAEDWFFLFKNAWKRRFDERWAEWNRLHRQTMLEKRILSFLGIPALPALGFRPWEGLWIPLSFRYGLSIAFLKGLFTVVYPAAIMKPLKILLIEGDFYRRENLAEYTDAFSVLEHQAQVIEMFERRLSDKGDFGEAFMIIDRERMITVKGKVRLENLMVSVELEAGGIVNRALEAFRSIDAILGGVLSVVRGGPYETLANLASVQGNFNERFRKDLQQVRQLLQTATEILSEASVIEKETV
jgi:hypothetical protein